MSAERLPDGRAGSELVAGAGLTLRAARAELASFREQMARLDASEMIGRLKRLDHVYREFPELEAEEAWSDLLSECLAAAAPETRDTAVAALGARIPSRLSHPGDRVARLADEPGVADAAVLARVARLAERWRGHSAPSTPATESRQALLDRAARLRPAVLSPEKSASGRRRAWPGGRLSFDEFALQWPCEILLADAADEAFTVRAYREILLRDPSSVETEQWVRLLRDNVVAKSRIIERLLDSIELRKMERRVRVVWQDKTFGQSGDPEAAEMPAVTWPTEGWNEPECADRGDAG